MSLPTPTNDSLTAPTLPRRMACWTYEGMLLFGVVFIAGYLFSALTQTRHALENRHAHQAFLFLVFGIYFTWFWAKGQTLAMKTWHIRVVDREGHAISQPRALLRYLLSWLWFMPAWLAAWLAGWHQTKYLLGGMLVWGLFYAGISRLLPQQQFLHDLICGTRVIDHRDQLPV